jgi:hypothetical protein
MDHLNSVIDAERSAKGHAIKFQLELAAAGEVPAKFNDAEVNAKHYLDNAGLYVPVPAELNIAKETCNEALFVLHKEIMKPRAEQTEEGKNAYRVVCNALDTIYLINKTWKPLAKRFKDYYDGTWASFNSVEKIEGATGKFYIYRFYVFEELADGKRFKPIGLLNPHAYNARKMKFASSLSAPGSFGNSVDTNQPSLAPKPFGGFRDFVDTSQPPPALPAGFLREGMMILSSIISAPVTAIMKGITSLKNPEWEDGYCTRCGMSHSEAYGDKED